MSSPIVGNATCRPFHEMLRPLGETPASRPARRMTTLDPDEIERLRDQAREDGFRQGYEEGREEGSRTAYEEVGAAGLAQVQAFGSELELVTNQIHAAINEWYENTAQAIAPVALVIAERIIAREIRMSRDSILDIAREAISEVTHSSHIRIRVNPFDSRLLNEHKDLLLSISPQLREIEIVDDSTIQGGCVLESDGGVIVATIHSKLKALIESAIGGAPLA